MFRRVLIGRPAPPLALRGFHAGKVDAFDLAKMRGSWVVIVFYPADFSFVCPTEIAAFSRAVPDFEKLHARVLGVSSDSVEDHAEWSRELGGVTFPLLSDPGGKTIAAWGATDPDAAPRAVRATRIVDDKGVLLHGTSTHRNVGRSVEETLRVLAALGTGRMCPVGWKPGDPTT